MVSYTVEELRQCGPRFALSMLIDALNGAGHPYVTYGQIRERLQVELQVPKIFPTQIGHVAGALMEMILERVPNAPLINVLITRGNGVPGVGAGPFLSVRYKAPEYRSWASISMAKKIEVVRRVQKEVKQHRDLWPVLYQKLFGVEYIPFEFSSICKEVDGLPPQKRNWGGCAESQEHKNLKGTICENPSLIGLSDAFTEGVQEVPMLSGDVVDVLFENETRYVLVEVKSCRSGDSDFLRGIYQCVKYRAVKEAELFPILKNVDVYLVTERPLNAELRDCAKRLQVKHRVVRVNQCPCV